MRHGIETVKNSIAKPSWLTQRIPASKIMTGIQDMVKDLGIHTVCQSACCPNIGECFSAATATFMVLGGICTRKCGFCAVGKGKPLPVDPDEPVKVAQAVSILKLKHAVVTSVTRDDLEDGGAGLIAECIYKIREYSPGTTVEVLVPDFNGNDAALLTVFNAEPEVFNHNTETVPRLYPQVRPGADYNRTLSILFKAAQYRIGVVKSGIMVGLGESEDEVLEVLYNLRAANVTSLTIGQYLSPSPQHLPVQEYVTPETFKRYEQLAFAAGFKNVASGPLVRSSYHAADHYKPEMPETVLPAGACAAN